MFLLCGKKILQHINNNVIFKFNDVDVFYNIYGKKDGAVNIFLHGWGQSGECFKEVISSCDDFCNIVIDFPPFGKSGVPSDWTIFSYANMIISICEALEIDRCNLIGHSFGGRVAIIVSALRKDIVNKLVLVASAGMKPKRKLSYYLRVYSYKTLKYFGFYPHFSGSSDYAKLDEGMKRTFSSIVNTHLEEYCQLIEADTLIVFGKEDTETPIYMAKRLNKLIKNSHLELLDHAGHFCFLDRGLKFSALLCNFLTKEE